MPKTDSFKPDVPHSLISIGKQYTLGEIRRFRKKSDQRERFQPLPRYD